MEADGKELSISDPTCWLWLSSTVDWRSPQPKSLPQGAKIDRTPVVRSRDTSQGRRALWGTVGSSLQMEGCLRLERALDSHTSISLFAL